MARIHALACVDSAAQIGDDVEIGPFCTVGPDVAIAAGCRLVSHVRVAGHTDLGERTIVHPFASLGAPPQSTAYRGEPTRLVIGADCDIREGVTISTGTQAGGGLTEVGAGGFYMANSHVAHDCRIGEKVTFANGATLGGHCEIGDYVFIGGLTAVHQFARIGAHAMIGGISGVSGDVIPFGLASGERTRLVGVNTIGMRRRGFTAPAIAAVRRAYRQLFFGAGALNERVEAVAAEFVAEPAVAQILDFIRTRERRPLCLPAGRSSE